jgi:hypothetical protein
MPDLGLEQGSRQRDNDTVDQTIHVLVWFLFSPLRDGRWERFDICEIETQNIFHIG